ncbi:MAG: hypothetical protein KDD62_06080, partial [Bdellovibrionales bacterium]|nr:hypothetical protein [Bdellovibrionales bacterium]
VKAPEKLLVDPTPKVGKGEVPEKLRPAPLAEIQAVDLALLGRVLGQGVQPVECSVVSSSACSVNPDGSNLRSFCE